MEEAGDDDEPDVIGGSLVIPEGGHPGARFEGDGAIGLLGGVRRNVGLHAVFFIAPKGLAQSWGGAGGEEDDGGGEEDFFPIGEGLGFGEDDGGGKGGSAGEGSEGDEGGGEGGIQGETAPEPDGDEPVGGGIFALDFTAFDDAFFNFGGPVHQHESGEEHQEKGGGDPEVGG